MTSTVRRTMRHALILAALCPLAPDRERERGRHHRHTTADTTVAGGCTRHESVLAARRGGLAEGNGDRPDTIRPGAGTLHAHRRRQLSLGSTTVGSNITVKGAGPRSTIIDAAGASRVFNATNGIVNLTGMKITGGLSPTRRGHVARRRRRDPLRRRTAPVRSLNLDNVALTGNTATLGGGGIAAPFESTQRRHAQHHEQHDRGQQGHRRHGQRAGRRRYWSPATRRSPTRPSRTTRSTTAPRRQPRRRYRGDRQPVVDQLDDGHPEQRDGREATASSAARPASATAAATPASAGGAHGRDDLARGEQHDHRGQHVRRRTANDCGLVEPDRHL